jgi:uncharacterized protein (TIGR03084 family)
MLQQVLDLKAEGDDLLSLLSAIDDADWRRVTQFKGWSVNDVMLHLYIGNVQAELSATDPDAYLALRRDILARRNAGLSSIEETRERLPDLHGAELLARWHGQLAALCARLGSLDAALRLKWNGPDMGVRMFTTARQMEHWAHAQEIYDVLGRERVHHERIGNVALIGVRTFGFSFSHRNLPVPPEPPFVRLTSPSGAVWEWNARSDTNAVIGEAIEFCQVVTQVRNVADTRLSVVGEAAERWMAIAQCFGGPPNDPPPKGTRFREMPGASRPP